MNKKNLIEGLGSDFSEQELLGYIKKQLSIFFNLNLAEIEILERVHIKILNRLRYCIEGVDNKYFSKNGVPYFSPLHSGQHLIYLYIYSHYCYTNLKEVELSEKIYYLNKILHSCDIYPPVKLPDIFFLEHPLGTVLGRATYGNNFFAMQGCTVGGNKYLKYPKIGSNVRMYSNSKIIGDSNIGNNVQVGANTYIKDTDIPDNALVFGQSPNLIIKGI